jgi:RNA-binding protein YhbY
MDKPNNIKDLTNDELLKQCSNAVEKHESIKVRIVELTLELEKKTDELHQTEFDWAQLIEEITIRNDELQQKIHTKD